MTKEIVLPFQHFGNQESQNLHLGTDYPSILPPQIGASNSPIAPSLPTHSITHTIKKTNAKKLAKYKEVEEIKIEETINSKDELTTKLNKNEEIVSSDKKDEIEQNDEINNARKKRRRSSAGIE